MNFKVHEYENLELSTQIIIKEALKRKIDVDVLDMKNNFRPADRFRRPG